MGGGRKRSGRKSSSDYSSWSEIGVTSLGGSGATVLRQIASTCLQIICPEGNSTWYRSCDFYNFTSSSKTFSLSGMLGLRYSTSKMEFILLSSGSSLPFFQLLNISVR